MAQGINPIESPRRRSGLLRDQVQLVKRKDSDRYEIVPIQDPLSFEKGFFVVVRACQLLAQKNDGMVLIGVAGPSGAGKTVFTDKIVNFLPDIAIINMDNYNDASRIIDGNFDDPRLTDYDTLLENIRDLVAGKAAQVPLYDYKTSSRIGYRTVEVPSSRLVIIEGIYALNEKLRPFMDLRVSVTGGVHFDLVKRVLRDIQCAGQEPEEIIHQISETVYPMYKAFIEPDLGTAHIKIINKFNPFSGFQNPTYILKSSRSVTVDQIKAILGEECKETAEETYDIYLLPPGEDPEACQSYLRMRNRQGKYTLMFEEWVTDSPFIISPRIAFEVSVCLLGGLMALGYTIASILKRNSHIFSNDKVCVKTDWLEQLNRMCVQIQGRDRLYVKYIAEELGLDGSYIPHTYIEQIQLEKLINDVMALPDDLKTKLSIDDELASNPKEALSRASADRRNKFYIEYMAADEEEEDYMGDLSQFLPSDDSRSSKKVYMCSAGSKLVKKSKTQNWQEERKVKRERNVVAEDRQTMENLGAAIPPSNIGFKLLKKMGYTPGSALGKEGSGSSEPVVVEIRRGRAGIGKEDPNVENMRREKENEERKKRKVEELIQDFGIRQKDRWKGKRVVINYRKAEAAVAQLENRDVVELENDKEEGDQEEEITEEDLINILLKLRNEFHFCLFCGFQYETMERLESNCPGITEEEH